MMLPVASIAPKTPSHFKAATQLAGAWGHHQNCVLQTLYATQEERAVSMATATFHANTCTVGSDEIIWDYIK